MESIWCPVCGPLFQGLLILSQLRKWLTKSIFCQKYIKTSFYIHFGGFYYQIFRDYLCFVPTILTKNGDWRCFQYWKQKVDFWTNRPKKLMYLHFVIFWLTTVLAAAKYLSSSNSWQFWEGVTFCGPARVVNNYGPILILYRYYLHKRRRATTFATPILRGLSHSCGGIEICQKILDIVSGIFLLCE